jgi:hypothetical protein
MARTDIRRAARRITHVSKQGLDSGTTTQEARRWVGLPSALTCICVTVEVTRWTAVVMRNTGLGRGRQHGERRVNDYSGIA